MKIRGVSAKSILDSRKEKTILISISTNVGNFSASSPSGKSTGKYEARSYYTDIEGDIKAIKQLSEYFSEELIEKFEDLRRSERKNLFVNGKGNRTLASYRHESA